MKITIIDRSVEVEASDSLYSNIKSIDIAEILRAAYVYAADPANAPATVIDGETGLALSASAVTDGQTEFAWREATEDDVLEYIQAYGGVAEYEYAEASEVIESLQADGLAPQKPLGDLAQTSVVTSNGQVQVIGLSGWTIDYKRKTVEATTTDDAEWESSLGSTKSFTAKANFMFIDADPSQQAQILGSITTQGFDSLPWNFFPTVATGRAAFQGTAIIDGITITSGVGKICALDVSLKGTGPLLVLAQVAPVSQPATVTGESAQV